MGLISNSNSNQISPSNSTGSANSITTPQSSNSNDTDSSCVWTMYNFNDEEHKTVFNKALRTCVLAAERDLWENYLEPVKNFVSDEQLWDYLTSGKDNILVANEGISMLELFKSVGFTHKLGTAFFRDGIYPSYDHPSNANMTVYRILLFATTSYGDRLLLRRFDKLFLNLFGWVLALPAPISKHMKGLYYRCEINPARTKKNYENSNALPCRIKLELWAGQPIEQFYERELINDIKKGLRDPELGLTPTKNYIFAGKPRPNPKNEHFRIVQ